MMRKTWSTEKDRSSGRIGGRGRGPGTWLWLLILALAWESFRVLADVNPLLMPSLVSVLREFVLGLVGGDMVLRWLMSLAAVGAGLAAGLVLALGASMLTRLSSGGDRLFSLLSSLMHPLPGLALLPLVILWFGTGFPAVLVIIVHAVLWPVFVNLRSGLKSLPESWVLYSRNLGMNRTVRFLHVELPGSFPHMVSGIRTGWARAWRSFIAAEMVFGSVGSGGLGWQLFESRVMMDTDALYAALLAVMLTGMGVESLVLDSWESRVRRRWGSI